MARKKKHDDDDELEAQAEAEPEAEGEPAVSPDEPAAVVAEDHEQPPAMLQLKDEAPVEEEKSEKKHKGPKVYRLQVRRNDAEWADVAHSTITLHPDHRDRQQASIGYTKAQAVQVTADWELAGYEVQLVEVGTEPEPAPEPEPVE